MIPAILLGKDEELLARVWGAEQRAQLAPEVEWVKDHGRVEVIFSTWGMPQIGANDFPSLRAVFYAAGTVKDFAEDLLTRNVMVVSAAAANAAPVAEYTLGQILFALKRGWLQVRHLREVRQWQALPSPGAYKSTVGVISLGLIGRKVCKLLRAFDVRVLAYDPMTQEREVENVSLEQLFRDSEVVTLHAPSLPNTIGMVTGKLLASMMTGATFINTARGNLVKEDELVEVLRMRPDLTAVLDVTEPEPPTPDSPLFDLPNVILTPHIAGSCGREVQRMANLMVEEFLTWKRTGRCHHAVTWEMLATSA